MEVSKKSADGEKALLLTFLGKAWRMYFVFIVYKEKEYAQSVSAKKQMGENKLRKR